jgi:hypothetical protein
MQLKVSVYPNTDTVRVIALSTLRADDQSAFQVIAERATHHADVLLQHEVVLEEKKVLFTSPKSLNNQSSEDPNLFEFT